MCRTQRTVLIALAMVGFAFSNPAAASESGMSWARASHDSEQGALDPNADELRPMYEVDPGPGGVAMVVRTAQETVQVGDNAGREVARPFTSLEVANTETEGPGTGYARYENELRRVLEHDGGPGSVAAEVRSTGLLSRTGASAGSIIARADTVAAAQRPSSSPRDDVATAAVVTPALEEGGPTCKMLSVNGDNLPVATCLACHPEHAGDRSHSVGGEYVQDGRLSLRPREEVLRRGIFLPANQIHCLTCHDARSPWKSHIALPPGAAPRPAVDPRSPVTYLSANLGKESSVPALPPGSAVTPTPLCMACHDYD